MKIINMKIQGRRRAMLNITEIRCQQACNKIKKGRLPFEWDLNIYRGCQHGCVYCYAMYSHDYLNANSHSEDIFVKVNIVEQLEKQLSSPQWKREEINIGGVTDSYQPLEAKYKLMPDILRLLIKYKTPCTISTKSDLVLRDYDLIDELSRITHVNIASTITCVDEDIRKKIEPFGKDASAKFHMLKEISKTNAITGLHHMPIIPYITDQRENIKQLYASASDSRVSYVLPGILYLRGKTRGVFFNFIRCEYPELLEPLTQFYQRGESSKAYRNSLYQMIHELRRKYHLSNDYMSLKKEKIAKETEEYKQISLFDMNMSETVNESNSDPSDPFVEIEVTPTRQACDAVSVPPVQSIDTVVDEKRALFYSMRQIARDTKSYMDHSKIFYDQALFMKGFEDDYTESVPFSSHYPYYQRMGYEQLRTYFTWRSRVRSGMITSTSVSYAFVYMYELLNQIGVTGPEDGLNKLMAFWQSFRSYDPVVDQYVLQWLKDYHIYYPLPHSFQEFVEDHHLMMQYPTVFGYESGKQDSFDLFTSISKYDVKQSIFYSDQTRDMINNCFYFILNRFRERFREQEQCFEDLVFYPLDKETTWTPFSRALFYPALRQPDRQVVISAREVYNCRENRWQYKRVMLSEQGRRLIGYIMKEMECSLRQAVKFKHKLTANPDICDAGTHTKLEKMGILLPQFVQTCVMEFYRMFTRKIISVDAGNLQHIRQQALQTQEKLIVPEEGGHSDREVQQPDRQTMVTAPAVSDAWSELKAILTQIELEALELILHDQSIKIFAMQNMVMLEVLVDGINQKAMDCIGDALLELDETVSIYEEYKPKLAEVMNTDGKFSTETNCKYYH